MPCGKGECCGSLSYGTDVPVMTATDHQFTLHTVNLSKDLLIIQAGIAHKTQFLPRK
jgi:hypothetical protein